MEVTPDYFFRLGCELTKSDPLNSADTANRRIKELFGVSPSLCSIIWHSINRGVDFPPGAEPRHLLFGLFLLKSYSTEAIAHVVFGVDEKTYRKWAWYFIELLAKKLDVVRKMLHQYHITLLTLTLFPRSILILDSTMQSQMKIVSCHWMVLIVQYWSLIHLVQNIFLTN